MLHKWDADILLSVRELLCGLAWPLTSLWRLRGAKIHCFIGINKKDVALRGKACNLDSCFCCSLHFCSIIARSPSVDDLVDNAQSKQVIHWLLHVGVGGWAAVSRSAKPTTPATFFSVDTLGQLSKFISISCCRRSDELCIWSVCRCVSMLCSQQQHLIWVQLVMILSFNQFRGKGREGLGLVWIWLIFSAQQPYFLFSRKGF